MLDDLVKILNRELWSTWRLLCPDPPLERVIICHLVPQAEPEDGPHVPEIAVPGSLGTIFVVVGYSLSMSS
jgi:hypothetical protein